mgnify:CR=1 FL=1
MNLRPEYRRTQPWGKCLRGFAAGYAGLAGLRSSVFLNPVQRAARFARCARSVWFACRNRNCRFGRPVLTILGVMHFESSFEYSAAMLISFLSSCR